MAVILSALVLIVVGVVQVTVLPYLTGSGPNVDLVLLLVLAWSIIKGVRQGLLCGLLGGLILDVVSAVPFGTTMAAMATVWLLGGVRNLPVLRGSAFAPLIAAGFATVVYDGLVMAVTFVFGWQWQWSDVLQDTILPSVLLNAIVMVPIYGLLYWLNKRSEPEIKW